MTASRLLLALLGVACAACGARSSLDMPDTGSGGSGGSPAQPSCQDQGVTYIYVVTDTKLLFAFDPQAGAFSPRGAITCPDMDGAFSMAVNRSGVGLVEFEDAVSKKNRIFRVDMKNGGCSETPYVPAPPFVGFGMGYSADTSDAGETLFVATGEPAGTVPDRLGVLDPHTLEITPVAPFSKQLGGVELTGTGDGRLFAFGIDQTIDGSHLAEIDRETAEVLSDKVLPFGQGTNAWAFGFWGGSFYFFTATGATSTVTKFDPEAKTLKHVGKAPGRIVGAGVSTCAPE
ncbi:MAG TPA: hypothetical protein VHB21_25260 [Minicystis sp.]|nr:hypothetical protein [Minicystis sp.]